MTLVSKTLVFVGLPLVLCVLLPLSVVWGRKSAPPDEWSRLSSETSIRMVFLADECEKYKRFYGCWPTHISKVESRLPPNMQYICFTVGAASFTSWHTPTTPARFGYRPGSREGRDQTCW